VRYLPLMQKLHASDNLAVKFEAFALTQTVLGDDIVKKFAATSILHHQVDIALGLDNFVKLDHIRVADAL